MPVMLRDLHRRVRAAGRGAADQKRHGKSLAFHLLRHMHHLIQRRRDQPAQSNCIRSALPRRCQNLRRRHHHAQIDDLVVVTLQDHAHDIFPNVVYVALHRRHHDPALRLRAPGFFRFHIRHQISDRLLHHARALHHLRQKHFPRAK